jgi:RNA polymerase sigma factor (sigma-70 family)
LSRVKTEAQSIPKAAEPAAAVGQGGFFPESRNNSPALLLYWRRFDPSRCEGEAVRQLMDRSCEQHLSVLFGGGGGIAGLSDGQLLERFVLHQSDGPREREAAELAFTVLVERHGPMVLRTCRAVLRSEPDVDDAFQATFLALVRRGSSLWVRDSLGPWLHRVACRAARRARAEAARRACFEQKGAEREAGRAPRANRDDLAECLHAEVDRLPERYRQPVVLCTLEGLSYDEAAARLRCPVGTVKSRLARARDLLRGRLVRRGFAPAVIAVASTRLAEAAPGPLPPPLVRSTIRAAATFAAGGAIAGPVALLSQELPRFVSTGRLRIIAAGVLASVGLAIGAGALAQQGSRKPEPPPGPRPGVGANAPKQVPAAPQPDRRWTATLPCGAAIEVIAVSTHPSGNATWWKPDGTPLAQPPCDASRTHISSDEDVLPYAVLTRITGASGLDHGWGFKEQRGGRSTHAARLHGKELVGKVLAVTMFPRNLKTFTVTFEAAAGPWRTLATSNGGDHMTSSSTLGPSYTFGSAIETKRGTHLTASHNIPFSESVRLVAVDRAGKEHTGQRSGGGGTGELRQTAAEFNLAPGAIKEFRLQACPYEHAEVAGIALPPAEKP